MFPDFDKMSIDQMLQKQLELKQKVLQASASGMSGGVIQQLQTMIDVLNTEIRTKSEIEKLHADRQSKIDNDEDPDDQVLNIGD